jgi:alkanesulfonate monooxygenase SsuD/methylene tetrahydromethanopterin reductase-like flavin-dependent oxidoreductase (luciferase family)
MYIIMRLIILCMRGYYYWVKDSRLYTKPIRPVPLYVAGLGEQSARLAGEVGDGFVTNELMLRR